MLQQRKISNFFKKTPKQTKPTIHDSQEAGPSGLCLLTRQNIEKYNSKDSQPAKKIKKTRFEIPSNALEVDLLDLQDISKEGSIPHFLKKHQKITALGFEGSLLITNYCIDEFKKHTNIVDLVDRHIDLLNRNREEKFKRFHNIEKNYIRNLYSNPRKKLHYPYVAIQYDCPESEIKLKTLASYPLINSEARYKKYMLYLKSNSCVGECRVDMATNNIVHDSVQNYLRKKLEAGAKQWHLSSYREYACDKALIDYYETLGREVWYLEDITVQKLCEISNFEEILEDELKHLDCTKDNSEYDACLEKCFRYFKKPSLRFKKYDFGKFKVHPQYELNLNVISMKQENFLTESLAHFRQATNIEEILEYLNRGKKDFDLDQEVLKQFFIYCADFSKRKLGIFSHLEIDEDIYKSFLRKDNVENINANNDISVVHNEEIVEDGGKNAEKVVVEPQKYSNNVMQPKQINSLEKPSKTKSKKTRTDSAKETVEATPEDPAFTIRQIRRKPNAGKRKLPSFLKRFDTTNDCELENEDQILFEIVYENRPPDENVASSEPCIVDGEIVMESAAAFLKRAEKEALHENQPNTDKITTENAVSNPFASDQNLLQTLTVLQSVPMVENKASHESSFGMIQLVSESLATNPPREIKKKIIQNISSYTNVLKIVKVLQAELLKEKFDSLWPINMKRYFVEYLERYIFIKSPVLNGITYKKGYSEEKLIRDLNTYFVIRDLDEVENEERNINENLAPVEQDDSSRPIQNQGLGQNSANVVILNVEVLPPDNEYASQIFSANNNLVRGNIIGEISIDNVVETNAENPIAGQNIISKLNQFLIFNENSSETTTVQNEIFKTPQKPVSSQGRTARSVAPILKTPVTTPTSGQSESIVNDMIGGPLINAEEIKAEKLSPRERWSDDVQIVENTDDPVICISDTEADSSSQRLLAELDSSYVPLNDQFMKQLEEQNKKTNNTITAPANVTLPSEPSQKEAELNDSFKGYELITRQYLDYLESRKGKKPIEMFTLPKNIPSAQSLVAPNKSPKKNLKRKIFGPLSFKKRQRQLYKSDSDDEDD